MLDECSKHKSTTRLLAERICFEFRPTATSWFSHLLLLSFPYAVEHTHIPLLYDLNCKYTHVLIHLQQTKKNYIQSISVVLNIDHSYIIQTVLNIITERERENVYHQNTYAVLLDEQKENLYSSALQRSRLKHALKAHERQIYYCNNFKKNTQNTVLIELF